jgi:two-component system, OmpR family, response regulator CpxR
MAKILIIEDDPLMSRLYHQAFTLEGFEVELAHDGQEGLDKAKTTSPGFILLDVMMPKLNGMQVLEGLKADPTTKMIPVVMLTNLGGQQDAEQAIAKGALRYLGKSDNEPKQVVMLVKELLGQQTPPPSQGGPAGTPPPVPTA